MVCAKPGCSEIATANAAMNAGAYSLDARRLRPAFDRRIRLEVATVQFRRALQARDLAHRRAIAGLLIEHGLSSLQPKIRA